MSFVEGAIAEEYLVALWLLLVWAVLGIAPAKVVLAGFSEDSWFFTIGALGIGVAIAQTSLLRRAAVHLLRWVPIRCYRTHRRGCAENSIVIMTKDLLWQVAAKPKTDGLQS